MGSVLGALGYVAGFHGVTSFAFLTISFLGLLLAARELGWIRFALPQRLRQTEKNWAHEFGFVAASAMWGFDVGLGFATRITTAGYLLLSAVALSLADPAFGALLMMMYWVGRALPVWVAPILVGDAKDSDALVEAVTVQSTFTHATAGLGLLWSGIVSIALALQSM